MFSVLPGSDSTCLHVFTTEFLSGGELLAVDDAESLEALASISNLEVEQVLTKEEEENQVTNNCILYSKKLLLESCDV